MMSMRFADCRIVPKLIIEALAVASRLPHCRSASRCDAASADYRIGEFRFREFLFDKERYRVSPAATHLMKI